MLTQTTRMLFQLDFIHSIFQLYYRTIIHNIFQLYYRTTTNNNPLQTFYT